MTKITSNATIKIFYIIYHNYTLYQHCYGSSVRKIREPLRLILLDISPEIK